MSSLHFHAYESHFLPGLIAARKQAGLTQVELAQKLHEPQSHISKVERGHRRLDIVEYVLWMHALNQDPTVLVGALSERLRHSRHRRAAIELG